MDKKGLTIVFSVTVVLLVICGGLIATAGFTNVRIPILSEILNKDTPHASNEPTILEKDSNTEIQAIDNKVPDSIAETAEADDDPFYGFGSAINFVIAIIEANGLCDVSLFDYVPPEWMPHIGYSFKGNPITLTELRNMSVPERIDFYEQLINTYEFGGEDYDWNSVNYEFVVSDYSVISDRAEVGDLIRNLCGTYGFPDISPAYSDSEVYQDFLSSNSNTFYILETNVRINGRNLLQVDEPLFYVYISDNNYYIAPTFMNNVMHMLAVYQQQYAQ